MYYIFTQQLLFPLIIYRKQIAKARKFDIYTVMYADESKLEAYMKKDDNTTAVARHVERNRRAAV